MNSPPPKGSRPRRLVAVWFADIVGFTSLFAADEPLALRLVDVFRTVAQGATAAHGGSVAKFMSDAVLAEFSSVGGAAAAAIQLQRHFTQVTGGWARGPHRLRVGVHLGDIAVADDGDLYGDGVNRASRVQRMAEPGQVLVSEDVFKQLRQRAHMCCTDVGSHTAKGIDEPIQVYRLEPTPRWLVGKIAPFEMSLEESGIQPFTRNLHQQVFGAQEPATAVNFLP